MVSWVSSEELTTKVTKEHEVKVLSVVFHRDLCGSRFSPSFDLNQILPDFGDRNSTSARVPELSMTKSASSAFFSSGSCDVHTALDLNQGVGGREIHTLGDALDLLLQAAGNGDQLVESFVRACLDHQCSFDDGDGVRIQATDFVHPIFLCADDSRVDDGIQFLNASLECEVGEFRAADGAIEIEYFASKGCDNLSCGPRYRG